MRIEKSWFDYLVTLLVGAALMLGVCLPWMNVPGLTPVFELRPPYTAEVTRIGDMGRWAYIGIPCWGTNVAKFRGIMLVGGTPEYTAAVARGQVPPRCRNVPEGAGCIDWLEPGEKSWEEARKSKEI
mgnify:CR=1 FL=1